MQTISAIGKSRITFRWTFVKRSVGIGLVVLGLLLFGMKGLLAGAVLNNWFAYFVNMALVSKYIGYKWYRQLLDLLPILVATIVSALVSYFSGLVAGCSLYIDGLIKLFVFLLVYCGWSFVFKPESFIYFKRIVRQFLSRFHFFSVNN